MFSPAGSGGRAAGSPALPGLEEPEFHFPSRYRAQLATIWGVSLLAGLFSEQVLPALVSRKVLIS